MGSLPLFSAILDNDQVIEERRNFNDNMKTNIAVGLPAIMSSNSWIRSRSKRRSRSKMVIF
mgnify:CR=1 FL=1